MKGIQIKVLEDQQNFISATRLILVPIIDWRDFPQMWKTMEDDHVFYPRLLQATQATWQQQLLGNILVTTRIVSEQTLIARPTDSQRAGEPREKPVLTADCNPA